MSWDEIWKIVLGILVSIGGIGAVIVAIIKYSADIIAKRLEEKYSHKLNKELQKYKSNLDNKTYITKTKFDTEFSIYRELSKAFFAMVKDISIMIPDGLAKYPGDNEERKKYEDQLYSNATKTTVAAQDTLNGNAAFIPSDLFEKYNNILALCKNQLEVFSDRQNRFSFSNPGGRERIQQEDYMRTVQIKKDFNELNGMIRKYLSNLDVLD